MMILKLSFGDQFMCTWNPALGQELILKPKPSNYKDKHAVAVLKDDVIVGHVTQ